MTRRRWIVAAVAVVGFFVGSGIGVGFGGGVAINGSVLLAAIAGFIAFLLAPKEERLDLPAREDEAATVENADALARSGLRLLKQFAALAGSALSALWNLEMRLLVVIGLNHFFQRFPILFAFAAIGLLAIFLPAGVIFVASGIAALLRDPRAANQYKVTWV